MDDIVERARALQAERGGSLSAALAVIEEEAATAVPEDLPEELRIVLRPKRRVMAWLVREFGGHPSLSIEERLGAYVERELGRAKAAASAASRAAMQVREGEAVTVTRDQLARQVPS